MSTNKIEGSHLKQHAPSLVKILSILRRKNPCLTADELWGRMKRFWDVPYLEIALQEFDLSEDVAYFQTLLVFEKTRQGDAEDAIIINNELWISIARIARDTSLSNECVRKKMECAKVSVELGLNPRGRVCKFYPSLEARNACGVDSTYKAKEGELIKIEGKKLGM